MSLGHGLNGVHRIQGSETLTKNTSMQLYSPVACFSTISIYTLSYVQVIPDSIHFTYIGLSHWAAQGQLAFYTMLNIARNMYSASSTITCRPVVSLIINTVDETENQQMSVHSEFPYNNKIWNVSTQYKILTHHWVEQCDLRPAHASCRPHTAPYPSLCVVTSKYTIKQST